MTPRRRYLKPVPIPDARRLASESGATRLLILGIDDAGNYAFTTFGRTKEQCRRMAAWADADGVRIALLMDRETQGEGE